MSSPGWVRHVPGRSQVSRKVLAIASICALVLAVLRIPADAGPQFRPMPGRDSGACRSRIPVHAGPPFRRMPGQLM